MNYYKLKIYISNIDLKEKYACYIRNHNIQVNTKFPSAGFDLLTPEKIIVNNELIKINTKIICGMFDSNNNPVSYYLYPRSSIIKTNYRLANSVGIIDSGYRGNIIAVFDNISNDNTIIEENSRLVQICSPELKPIIVELVESIDDISEITERGANGFGSTGI